MIFIGVINVWDDSGLLSIYGAIKKISGYDFLDVLNNTSANLSRSICQISRRIQPVSNNYLFRFVSLCGYT
jgi:hypothetical protein